MTPPKKQAKLRHSLGDQHAIRKLLYKVYLHTHVSINSQTLITLPLLSVVTSGGPMYRFWKSQAICAPQDLEALRSYVISSLVPIYVQTVTLLHHPTFPGRGTVWTVSSGSCSHSREQKAFLWWQLRDQPGQESCL